MLLILTIVGYSLLVLISLFLVTGHALMRAASNRRDLRYGTWHWDRSMDGNAIGIRDLRYLVTSIGMSVVLGLLFAAFLAGHDDQKPAMTVLVIVMVVLQTGFTLALRKGYIDADDQRKLALPNTHPWRVMENIPR